MKCLVVGIALLIAAAQAGAQAADSARVSVPIAPRDNLFGLDKPKHFVLSAFIESASFAGLEVAGSSYKTAMAGGLSAAAIFAVGREIHDGRTKGLFSFADLFWDALGGAAATVMLRHTYR